MARPRPSHRWFPVSEPRTPRTGWSGPAGPPYQVRGPQTRRCIRGFSLCRSRPGPGLYGGTGWTEVSGGVWKVELPNSFFGDYNPYALKLSGGWLNYGQWHHRGDVYLDEEAFVEQCTLEEVRPRSQRWSCEVQGNTTTIWANFGTADPNKRLSEINVRESLFMPEVNGLSYVTIDGFHFLHAAANWAPPGIPLQTGAVGPRLGKRWIIQNCTIINARCVGIILGRARQSG